jgi:hypothetical protein
MSPPANWSDLAQPRPVGDRRPPFTLPGFGACRGAWRRCSAPCDVTSVRVDRAGSRAGEAARGDFDVFLRRAATHRKRGVGSRSRAGPVEVDVRDGHLVNPWVTWFLIQINRQRTQGRPPRHSPARGTPPRRCRAKTPAGAVPRRLQTAPGRPAQRCRFPGPPKPAEQRAPSLAITGPSRADL